MPQFLTLSLLNANTTNKKKHLICTLIYTSEICNHLNMGFESTLKSLSYIYEQP